MTPQEYEQKKREFKKKMLAELFKTKKALVNYETAVFNYTFDRAYALGQQDAQLLNNPKQLDAEGEDKMLCVSRKEVQELYKNYCTERDKEEKRTVNRLELSGRVAVLEELFSRSMCLPDDAEVGTKGDTKDDTKAPTFTDECESQCKSTDRLRIAAMLAAGMLANDARCYPIDRAIELADALIAKAGKGGAL